MTDEQFNDINTRVKALEQTMPTLKNAIDENTKLTQQTLEKTGDMLSVFEGLTGAFKSIERLGKLLQPLGWIAGAIAAFVALWASLKGGK